MANKYRGKTYFENLKAFAHGIGAAIAVNKLREAPARFDAREVERKAAKQAAKLVRRAKRAGHNPETPHD